MQKNAIAKQNIKRYSYVDRLKKKIVPMGRNMEGLTLFQFGCCLSIASFVPQTQQGESKQKDVPQQLTEGFALLRNNGYDFVELTVGALSQLTEEEFAKAKEAILNSELSVPVFNSFIPAALKITGPDASLEKLEAYVDLAMQRVRAVGGKQIVFGSGGARNLPEGTSHEEGMEQIKQFLRLCEKLAAKHDILIAIEPLNRKESNVINSVKDGLALAQELNLPHIKVLADAYHMDLENETFEIVSAAVKSGLLSHVHIADRNRQFPGTLTEQGINFAALFAELRKAGYAGLVSAECGPDNFAENSAKSLVHVKQL
jgi:D-psicose/D-tagatose/L-ribulose 3-epimerase